MNQFTRFLRVTEKIIQGIWGVDIYGDNKRRSSSLLELF